MEKFCVLARCTNPTGKFTTSGYLDNWGMVMWHAVLRWVFTQNCEVIYLFLLSFLISPLWGNIHLCNTELCTLGYRENGKEITPRPQKKKRKSLPNIIKQFLNIFCFTFQFKFRHTQHFIPNNLFYGNFTNQLWVVLVIEVRIQSKFLCLLSHDTR